MKKVIGVIAVLLCASTVYAQGYPQHIQKIRETRNLVNIIWKHTTEAETRNMLGDPDRTEVYLNSEGKIIKALYYLTDYSFICLAEKQENCYTPLVFEGGEMIGKGSESLEVAIRRYELKRQF